MHAYCPLCTHTRELWYVAIPDATAMHACHRALKPQSSLPICHSALIPELATYMHTFSLVGSMYGGSHMTFDVSCLSKRIMHNSANCPCIMCFLRPHTLVSQGLIHLCITCFLCHTPCYRLLAQRDERTKKDGERRRVQVREGGFR